MCMSLTCAAVKDAIRKQVAIAKKRKEVTDVWLKDFDLRCFMTVET